MHRSEDGKVHMAQDCARSKVIQANIRRTHQIRKEIRKRTGLSYPPVQIIPTGDARVAAQLLPILADLHEEESLPDIRSVLAGLFFCDQTAKPFVTRMIEQWKRESYPFTSNLLTQVLMKLADKTNAQVFWETWKDLEVKPRDLYSMIAKLATLDPANLDAREALVKALCDGALSEFEISDAAKVRDPRIVE